DRHVPGEAAEPDPAGGEGGHGGPVRAGTGGGVLRGVHAQHAGPGHAGVAVALFRGDPRPLRGECTVRCRVPWGRAGRGRLRLRVPGHVRADVGLLAPALRPRSAEHAPLLVAHGACDRAGHRRVRLRPLHAGQRDAPLQAAMGRRGPTASVVAVVAAGAGCAADAGQADLPACRRGVAATAPAGHHSGGSDAGAGAAVSVLATRWAQPSARGERDAAPPRLPPFRHQPPVHSPVPLRALVPAAGQLLRLGADPRPGLAALLEAAYAAERVVLCSSGTAALQLAIRIAAAHASEPGPVALPACTCYDVAAAAIGADAGSGLVLFDVEPSGLAPDLGSLERVLRGGASVVVVSPLYGIPADWDAVQALCDEHGAVLVEDAAQGHGASWRGRPVGALGRISVLSFGRGKGWTGGKGGALLLRGAAAAADEE